MQIFYDYFNHDEPSFRDFPLTSDNPNKINCPTGDYASKWGVSDLYEEAETLLKTLINSDEDFETDWWGVHKEIVYYRYSGKGNKLCIQVWNQMDSLWDEAPDLLFDAFYSLQSEGKIPESMEMDDDDTDEILNRLYMSDVDDKAISQTILDRSAPFEDIMNAADASWDEAKRICDEYYEYVKNEVLDYYENKEN